MYMYMYCTFSLSLRNIKNPTINLKVGVYGDTSACMSDF